MKDTRANIAKNLSNTVDEMTTVLATTPLPPKYILPVVVACSTDNLSFWRFLILLVVILWATNFPVIKEIYLTLPFLDASLYSAVRFTISGLIFVPVLFFSKWDKGKYEMMISSMTIGAVISVAYLGQGIGLTTSTADKGAFICMLQVVVVALVNGFREKNLNVQVWLTVVLAVAGTAFIELYGSSEMNIGDLWLMLQPMGFGTGYLLLEQVIRKYPENALEITAFKLLTVAFCMNIWAFTQGHTLNALTQIMASPKGLSLMLYTGGITTALCIYLQSVAFKRVSAQDCSIIVTTEPVWAGIFSYLVLGETLNSTDILARPSSCWPPCLTNSISSIS